MRKDSYYIAKKIIEVHENPRNTSWKKDKGTRTLNLGENDDKNINRSELCQEALELEAAGLIVVRWYDKPSAIESIKYKLEKLPEIYALEGHVPKKQRIAAELDVVNKFASEAETAWLNSYYQEILVGLEKGKQSEDLNKYGTLLFHCLNALEKLKEPIFVRIFSSQHFSDVENRGSKVFQNVLKPRVIAVAKKYHPMVDDSMEDYQVLEQLYLADYAQELALKGDLKLELNGRIVDLAQFPYGTVLNTETLKHAKICGKQDLKKIITVENKANFVAMPYEKGVLILFSHGFFSPLEREFLQKLECVLERDNCQVQYLHTGDLDYGGVRIFQHIRKNIFPGLQPFQMDVEQFERYQEFASVIEEASWQKLGQMNEPRLQLLIQRILETRKVIEQEVFLIKE